MKPQIQAASPGDFAIWLSLPLSKLRLPQTKNGFNRSSEPGQTACYARKFLIQAVRLPPFSLYFPARHSLHPEEAEGRSLLATSLSYTRQYHVYARIPS